MAGWLVIWLVCRLAGWPAGQVAKENYHKYICINVQFIFIIKTDNEIRLLYVLYILFILL